MTDSPDVVTPPPPPAATATTAELPSASAPAPVTQADLLALEQRFMNLVAQSNGFRANEIRQIREQLGNVGRDIQQIRLHQETQDRRVDGLENEVRPAIREIKENSGRIDTSLDGIKTLLERDRRTVDDHTASILQLNQQVNAAGQNAAAAVMDVGDLRTRLADVVSPLAHVVLGDPKTPSMLQRLEAIQQKMELDRQEFQNGIAGLGQEVRPVIEMFNDWHKRLESWKAYLKTPRGMAAAFGGAVLIIELFSKLDLIGIVRSFGSLFTGG